MEAVQLFEYDDYDLQTSVDSRNRAKLQIVGIRKNGQKDILKEFDHEVDFVGFDPNGAPKQDLVAVAAPKGKDRHMLKVGGAFVLGMVIGGFVVYMVMKSNADRRIKELFHGAPASNIDMPPQYPQAPLPAQPDQGQDDKAMLIGSYDSDIFIRGDGR